MFLPSHRRYHLRSLISNILRSVFPHHQPPHEREQWNAARRKIWWRRLKEDLAATIVVGGSLAFVFYLLLFVEG